MSRSISPRDAAEMLGISTETLRRWEREGRLLVERTPGGQRRYREDAITALLAPTTTASPTSARISQSKIAPSESDRAASKDHEIQEATPSPGNELPHWERRVREERADLEIARIRSERSELLRAQREEAAIRASEEMERERMLVNQRENERSTADANARERARLAELRAHGRLLSLRAPPEHQAKVVRDLESFVTSEAFPLTMSSYVAEQTIAARVDRVLKPWREAEEAKAAKTKSARALAQLIAQGESHAFISTLSWNSKEAEGAREDVRVALHDEVSSDWSHAEVCRLVDEILEDWDDDDS
jgi:excisionase family DNA binding protein